MIDCKYVVACGACDNCMGTPDPATLWQDLADVLNALEAAGHDPVLSGLMGQINGEEHSVCWDVFTNRWVVAK